MKCGIFGCKDFYKKLLEEEFDMIKTLKTARIPITLLFILVMLIPLFRSIKVSRIFINRSHGAYNANETYVVINEDTLDTVSSLDIQNEDLSNLDLAMFVFCHSAKNRDTGKNIVDASVRAGARSAIGFLNEIPTSNANVWTEYFFKYRAEGYGIQESCQKAAIKVNDSLLYSYQIAGEEN